MSRNRSVAAELVPIADRVRWMLGFRAVLVAMLFVIWLTEGGAVTAVPGVAGAGVIWLTVSVLMSLTAMRPSRRGRGGRPLAVIGFTIGLLGDGLLLAAASYRFDGLNGPIGYLIVLHGIAVTLLASFRTGAKLALWHSLLALLVVEAASSGVLRPLSGVAVNSTRIGLYLAILWGGVLTTASFAAINERELRRRRYDSEVLRQFGLSLSDEQEAVAVAYRLARFSRDELLATRALVVVQPCEDGFAVPDSGYAVLAGSDADDAGPTRHRMPGDAMSDGVLGRALAGRHTTLVARLDPEQDRWLAEALPGATNLVVVPFNLEQVTGAVVVEHPRRSSQRHTQRAERRMVTTTEQATAHASMAIGRAILVERIKAAADLDGLTRVANRRRFDTALSAAVDAAIANGHGFGLIMIDLDHFKKLNDEHGHQTGDEVLRQAARCIEASCREGDLAARYGGEEFGVILGAGDEAAAFAVAERIRRAVRAAETAVPVSASLGVAVFPGHAGTAAELVAAADAALYAAKKAGRNRAELYRAQSMAAA